MIGDGSDRAKKRERRRLPAIGGCFGTRRRGAHRGAESDRGVQRGGQADAGRSVVRFGLAGAYLDAGQPEEAVLAYEETIRLKPDYSAAHRGLGRALEQAGRLAEAAAAYAAGLEVAARTGDLQTKKKIEVFLRRLEKRGD